MLPNICLYYILQRRNSCFYRNREKLTEYINYYIKIHKYSFLQHMIHFANYFKYNSINNHKIDQC